MTALNNDTDTFEPIQIALAADRGFVRPLAVTLTSLANAHEPGELAVTVVHDGVGDADCARVERGLRGRLAIDWKRVPVEELEGAHNTLTLPPAALFRLLLPEILPTVDRLIYLDADLVITGSLRPLWETPLGENQLAAVRDAGTPFPAGPLGTNWQGLGLRAADPYFNSGMLLMATRSWRETGVSARAREVLQGSAARWGDQDALNVALRGKWLELSRKWNLQTPDAEQRSLAWALWRDDVEQAVERPIIIHYTERNKPWHSGNRHPFAARWYEVLDQTAWSGWRAEASRPIHERVSTRTKLAWSALKHGRAALARWP